MTVFDFPVSDRDPAVVHEIKNKKTENVKDVIEGLTLSDMEELNTLMTEKGKYIMTDQNIRQYVSMLADCREIEVCLHSEYIVSIWGAKTGGYDSVITGVMTVS